MPNLGSLDCLQVNPTYRLVVNVTRTGLPWPDKAAVGLASGEPAILQSDADSRGHWNYPPRSGRLAMCHSECPVAPVDPRNTFPAEPETFIGSQPCVKQDRDD